MLVKQILNNNVVSAVDEDGLEVILRKLRLSGPQLPI